MNSKGIATCSHVYVPVEIDNQGEPLFRVVLMVSREPSVLSECDKCGLRDWFTQSEWAEMEGD